MNTFKFTSLFEFVLCLVVLVSWSYCICQQRGEMQCVSVATVSCLVSIIQHTNTNFSHLLRNLLTKIMAINNILMNLP